MNLLRIFHYTAITEAWSYLILLGVAMPLKYWADWPFAVQVVGAAHGALFIAYCLFLAWYFVRKKLSFGLSLWGFVASLLPFGTFFFDRTIRRMPEYPTQS